MHRSEADEFVRCASCGAQVDRRERVFGFEGESALCYACAVDRGGTYDAAHDRWTEQPDVSDLASRPEHEEPRR